MRRFRPVISGRVGKKETGRREGAGGMQDRDACWPWLTQSGKTHDPPDFSTRCKKPAIPMFPKGDGFSVVAPSGIDPLT